MHYVYSAVNFTISLPVPPLLQLVPKVSFEAGGTDPSHVRQRTQLASGV